MRVLAVLLIFAGLTKLAVQWLDSVSYEVFRRAWDDFTRDENGTDE
jgi:hypothetical protein